MTSDPPNEAYVWIWLPGATDPVVAGRLVSHGADIVFNYGQSYLARADSIPIYMPELPLRAGAIAPLPGLDIAGCIADAAPDAWGQRVIMNQVIGAGAGAADPASLGHLSYLLNSGSDRIGALDFQQSPDTFVPRESSGATLIELMESAQRVEQGVLLSPALDQALIHGSSIGGARPKALLTDQSRKLIAKFSTATDSFPVVKGEYIAMDLARRAGLNVAPVELVRALGKDVLLVERFDRTLCASGWRRRSVVSALTILELGDMFGRYATYLDLAHVIRARFTDAGETLRELFARITFNILAGNTDDHARNHAAFWDGTQLMLTPAYDICPQLRAGGETRQAMAYGIDGVQMSQLSGCVGAASSYLLSQQEARAIIDHQIDVIKTQWNHVCDVARLTAVERAYFWHRQFLNPYSLEGY